MIQFVNRYDDNSKNRVKKISGKVIRKIFGVKDIHEDLIKPPIIKKRINSFIKKDKKGEIPLFHSVEIETINRCNFHCEFCPINADIDSRKFHKMKAELFYKIIDELALLDYNGLLALFSNNEPFLDNRIIDFAKYASEHVRYAQIYLFTNGSVLSVEKFRNIIPYLNKIILDNYNDDMELTNEINQIVNYCNENNQYSERVEVHFRKEHEILNSRGGLAPNKPNPDKVVEPCILPFQQMVIRPDGKVSLCCNDAIGSYTMGDVGKQSLVEIWQGIEYTKIRKQMTKGRAGIRLFDQCDSKYGYLKMKDGKWDYRLDWPER